MNKIEQKQYLHFDAPLQQSELLAIVRTPAAVAANSFLPFLRYKKTTPRFSDAKKERGNKSRSANEKPREISYAGRLDAAIFHEYREKLMPLYEMKLRESGINDVAIAYRKIPISERVASGKCNIHHASDVFGEIRKLTPCVAIALDIEGFFDSIDHRSLYSHWCEILGTDGLPKDHLQVFKKITNYAFVDRDKCLEVVGYPASKKQKQLCSPRVFREKVVPLIQKNKNEYGIPQGSPISDLLANLSLLHFDANIDRCIKKIGGVYRRYSDDIVIIIPGETLSFNLDVVIEVVAKELLRAGNQLHIKNSKTCVAHFIKQQDKIACVPVKIPDVPFKKKHFEYLGFSFDGKKVLLRNPTVSGFYRRLRSNIVNEIYIAVRRYPNKTIDELKEILSSEKIIETYIKIKNFDEVADEYENWTFWSYALRAHKAMGSGKIIRSGIEHQLRRKKKIIEHTLNYRLPRIFHSVRNETKI